MEQIDGTIKDLANAIILRALQDFNLKSLNLPGSYTKGSKEKIKHEAYKFLLSEECHYMCECIGVDYQTIRKSVTI